MALGTYAPAANRVVHPARVDFITRDRYGEPVYVVQGDNILPVVAVELYKNGEKYALPADADGSIRWKKPKPDPHFVYNKLLGVNSDRTVAYFEVTAQMATTYGEVEAIIEFTTPDFGIIGSSRIPITVDKNPVQDSDIESTGEYKTLLEYVDDAEKSKEASEAAAKKSEEYAGKAKESENAAKQSELSAAEHEKNAKNSADAAKTSEGNAKQSELNAKDSETNAKESELNAKDSETNAEASNQSAGEHEQNAKNYADAAKVSEENSKQSELNSKDSENNAKQSELNAADHEETTRGYMESAEQFSQEAGESAAKAEQYDLSSAEHEQNAKDSADAAKLSEQSANDSSLLSKSWAVGETGVREGEDTDNSKYYAKLAQSISQGCQGYYATDELLAEKVPEGQDGFWAIVGETDTIWIWDGDTQAWIDSGNKTDLSQYYTKTDMDNALAKKANVGDAYTKAESDGSFVKKTGDTMTGDLTLSGEEMHIKFNSGVRDGSPITFYKGVDIGSEIDIGDGGRVIIGSGEAASSLHNALPHDPGDNGAEELDLASDGGVFVHANCQDVAARKTFIFDTEGNLTIPGSLIVPRNMDADGTLDNIPALVVGGPRTGLHLEMDGNELMCKATATTVADLNLNINGGRVLVGPGGVTSSGPFVGNLTGTATTANNLATKNVGSATMPVFFQNGVPVQTGGVLAVGITGNAATSTTTAQIKWGTTVPTTADITPGQIYLKYS